MRIAHLLIALLLPAAAAAAPVSLHDGAMTIDVPDDFTALSQDEAQLMFARGNVPSAIYGNAGRDVTIAVTFSQGAVEPDGLEELKSQMEGVLSSHPDVRFITREITVRNERRWVHFELTSVEAGAPARNHIYLTSFRGRMLVISLNARLSAYAAHAQALQHSFRSIRLDDR
jgi:hypothetical protein